MLNVQTSLLQLLLEYSRNMFCCSVCYGKFQHCKHTTVYVLTWDLSWQCSTYVQYCCESLISIHNKDMCYTVLNDHVSNVFLVFLMIAWWQTWQIKHDNLYYMLYLFIIQIWFAMISLVLVSCKQGTHSCIWKITSMKTKLIQSKSYITIKLDGCLVCLIFIFVFVSEDFCQWGFLSVRSFVSENAWQWECLSVRIFVRENFGQWEFVSVKGVACENILACKSIFTCEHVFACGLIFTCENIFACESFVPVRVFCQWEFLSVRGLACDVFVSDVFVSDVFVSDVFVSENFCEWEFLWVSIFVSENFCEREIVSVRIVISNNSSWNMLFLL